MTRCAEHARASCLATNVLPVPGGPWKRTPRGGVIPRLLNRFGSLSGRRTISSSAFRWWSSPATPWNGATAGAGPAAPAAAASSSDDELRSRSCFGGGSDRRRDSWSAPRRATELSSESNRGGGGGRRRRGGRRGGLGA